MKRIAKIAMLSLCAVGLFVGNSLAQAYPNRPIRLVVPFPPGGVTDLVARTIAKHMGDDLGQPVAIDNRPGAGGKIGSQHIAASAADGYTLGLMTSGTHAILPVIDSKLGYDAVKDFAPVGLVMSSPFTLYVGSGTPYQSLQDLVKAAKEKPGSLSYGSAGVGTAHHMFFELFKATTGTEIVHVSYRGEAPAVNDMLGGQIPIIMMPGGNQHVSSGKFRPLATTGEKRWFVLPNVPTMAESGYPGATALGWAGLVMPANPPADVLAKLQASLAKALKKDDVGKVLQDAGYDLLPAVPAELTRWIEADISKWRHLVANAGLKFED